MRTHNGGSGLFVGPGLPSPTEMLGGCPLNIYGHGHAPQAHSCPESSHGHGALPHARARICTARRTPCMHACNHASRSPGLGHSPQLHPPTHEGVTGGCARSLCGGFRVLGASPPPLPLSPILYPLSPIPMPPKPQTPNPTHCVTRGPHVGGGVGWVGGGGLRVRANPPAKPTRSWVGGPGPAPPHTHTP